MKPVYLTPLTKDIEIELIHNPVQLSFDRKQAIEHFWEEVNQDGKYHRGEIFNVHSYRDEGEKYKVLINETDFAYYIHTVRKNKTDHEGCKVIYSAGLVETSDSVLVFGEMGQHTAYPGRLQFVGGGISKEDLKGNKIDVKQSLHRELGEELGMKHDQIQKCVPTYLKTGGTYDFLVVLYHITLTIDKNEFMHHYRSYSKQLLLKGIKPEFEQLEYLDKKDEYIKSFLTQEERSTVDYLVPNLSYLLSKR